ncbi:MAG: RidA family protein [Microthrixaceae bacterium]|nr:RidA family protein [Microthrixaceae bacterium]
MTNDPIQQRLTELGISLPPASKPAGTYVSSLIDGDLIWVGGHGPFDGESLTCGKVGGDLTAEQGQAAARLTGLSILATLESELGSLSRIERIVKVFGMVNVAPGFTEIPTVINGCSDLMVEVFGEAGRHARSAVGMAELPFGMATEIELVARVR